MSASPVRWGRWRRAWAPRVRRVPLPAPDAFRPEPHARRKRRSASLRRRATPTNQGERWHTHYDRRPPRSTSKSPALRFVARVAEGKRRLRSRSSTCSPTRSWRTRSPLRDGVAKPGVGRARGRDPAAQPASDGHRLPQRSAGRGGQTNAYTLREMEHQWADLAVTSRSWRTSSSRNDPAEPRQLRPKTYVVAHISTTCASRSTCSRREGVAEGLREGDDGRWSPRVQEARRGQRPEPAGDLRGDGRHLRAPVHGRHDGSPRAQSRPTAISSATPADPRLVPGRARPEVTLNCLPMFHLAERRDELVDLVPPRWSSSQLQDIRAREGDHEHRVTLFPGVPALFTRSTTSPAENPDMTSVKSYFSGSAPIARDGGFSRASRTPRSSRASA